MSIFDKIFKSNESKNEEKKSKYYDGEFAGKAKFTYYFDVDSQKIEKYKKVSLTIGNRVDFVDEKLLPQGLYECEVWYNYGKASLGDYATIVDYYGFEKVLVALDLERMKSDTAYTEFVCCNVLNPSRIRNLHDAAFGITEGKPLGNYVGGVGEKESRLYVKVNAVTGKMINDSSKMTSLRAAFAKRMERERQEQLEMEAAAKRDQSGCTTLQEAYAEQIVQMLADDNSNQDSYSSKSVKK